MKKIFFLAGIATAGILGGCTDLVDTDVNTHKQTFVYSKTVGEYVTTLDLTGPDEGTTSGHISVFNTSFSTDSLWVQEDVIWGSTVRVKFDGKNSFAITGGSNIEAEDPEFVDITGQVFPEQDSIQITWRYPQGGDPADDYVITAHGRLYNGINN